MQDNKWARLLAYVSGLVNQRLLLQCEYLVAENRRRDAGVVSDCNLEQPGDEMELAFNLTDAYPPGLPLPNRMHRFVTLDRAVGSPARAYALAHSHPSSPVPMVL